MSRHAEQADPHFTVFIRLPFPRGDFVDPPPVDWNASKDQELWDILSRPSKGNDIDWKALADNFDVTLPFLLQQAAWLYDRQLSQVRAQMRKVGNAHSTSPSPAPASVSGSTAIGSQAMKRGGSGAPVPRPPQKTPQHSGAQSPRNVSTPSQAKAPAKELGGRRITSYKKETAQPTESPPPEDEDSSELSSSSSDSESEVPSRRGPGARRFGKFSVHKPATNAEDDDDDDSPAFLPVNTKDHGRHKSSAQDPSSTLRIDTTGRPSSQRNRSDQTTTKRQTAAESSTSSASSGVAIHPPRDNTRPVRRGGGPLSPHRAAELARLSPRRRAAGKEGSDGTPSMGSSFSDLDDASVTQSALEEALLSNMQHGGVASRMSTISQALKSRYL
ncbi:hypothetical protein FQN54_004777 [Arachnomyces sp. PD_36]|nr:hypothetical protein FQN54_004777 [Arachnomyces sp. PD_36]